MSDTQPPVNKSSGNLASIVQLLANIDNTLSQILSDKSHPSEQSPQSYTDPYDESDTTLYQPEMTQPTIKVIRETTSNDANQTIKADQIYYIPSMTAVKASRCTTIGLVSRYGVKLPPEFQDIDLNDLVEKSYTDGNGDQQRVLVPLFKKRRDGEHYQDFYQRVGLLLPPID